jgi:hypothetical protein
MTQRTISSLPQTIKGKGNTIASCPGRSDAVPKMCCNGGVRRTVSTMAAKSADRIGVGIDGHAHCPVTNVRDLDAKPSEG